MKKLTATVDRVMACRPNPGKRFWHFLSTQHGGASGVAPWEIVVGSDIEMEGDWDVWRGSKIFRWKSIRPHTPTDERGMLYYACRLAKGLGDRTAEKIWDALGAGWREIQPGQVSTVTEPKIVELRAALEIIERDAEMAKTIVWLTGHGVTELAATKAWNEWKHGTIGKVENNPFILTELERVAFDDVDRGIRVGLGIGDEDERRIEAGIYHAYKTATQDGSTVARDRAVIQAASTLLGLFHDVVVSVLETVLSKGRMVGLADGWITMQTEWDAEKEVYEWMVAI